MSWPEVRLSISLAPEIQPSRMVQPSPITFTGNALTVKGVILYLALWNNSLWKHQTFLENSLENTPVGLKHSLPIYQNRLRSVCTCLVVDLKLCPKQLSPWRGTRGRPPLTRQTAGKGRPWVLSKRIGLLFPLSSCITLGKSSNQTGFYHQVENNHFAQFLGELIR